MIEIEFKNQLTATAHNEQENTIIYSKKIIDTLKVKAKEHNDSSNNKVTWVQLKQLYISGASEKFENHNANQCGWARVNMFLRMANEVDLMATTAKEQSKKATKTVLDFSCLLQPNEQDYISASEDIKKYSLDFDFEDVASLYLTEPEPLSAYFHQFL